MNSDAHSYGGRSVRELTLYCTFLVDADTIQGPQITIQTHVDYVELNQKIVQHNVQTTQRPK
jgi:hypothetical protein